MVSVRDRGRYDEGGRKIKEREGCLFLGALSPIRPEPFFLPRVVLAGVPAIKYDVITFGNFLLGEISAELASDRGVIAIASYFNSNQTLNEIVVNLLRVLSRKKQFR